MSASGPFSDEMYLRALMDNIADSIYFKDRDCCLLKVSRKMAQDLGYSDPDQVVGKTDFELFGEEFGQQTAVNDRWLMETGEPIIGLVESRRLANGELNWTSTTKLPLRDDDGNIIGLMGITREINELIKASLEMQYLATHGALTRLPNRFLLVDRLQGTLARASRNNLIFAVLFVDLDQFKHINDTYGHDFGDLLLQGIASRLIATVRRSDTVARLGGDEFVIVLEAIQQKQDALTVAQKIQRELVKPFVVFGCEVQATSSIGISLYPEHGKESEALLQAADHAMYLAKKSGKNCSKFFSPPNIPTR